jgi:AraC family transcriptional regulator
VSVDELAALVGMGGFRFSRLFKLATGKPPYQYILHKRIEPAKSILAEQSVSISDVENVAGHRGAARIKRRADSHGGVRRAQGLRQLVPQSPGDVERPAGARELPL